MASRRDVADAYPLSPMQRGMVFHAALAPMSDMYFEQIVFDIKGEIDRLAFEKAWQSVVDRHEVFRSAFAWEHDDVPLQVVFRRVELTVEWHDWSNVPNAMEEERLRAFLIVDRHRGMNISRAPLMRVHVLAFGRDRHKVVWDHHHLVLDGWSLGLVFDELFCVYDAAVVGKSPRLARPTPYRKYIDWLGTRGTKRAEAVEFWRRYLYGMSSPNKLLIRRGGGANPYELTGYERQTIAVPSELCARLDALAATSRLTLNTIAQTTWALLLRHYTSSDDVIFGATVSGRSEMAGAESIVGMMINTLPMRARLRPDESVLELAARLQLEHAATREYEWTDLSEIRRWAGIMGDDPLFETNLSFQNYPSSGRYNSAARERVVATEWRGPTNFVLSATVERTETMLLGIGYFTSCIDANTVVRVLRQWVNLLRLLAARPTAPCREVTPLTDEERCCVVREWNDTKCDELVGRTLPELLNARAYESDAVAIIEWGGRCWTYGEVLAAARAGAAVLRSRGVCAEVPIGILLEKTAFAAIAIWSVLLAGGVFVPVDVRQPDQQVSRIFSNARVALVLADASTRTTHPGIAHIVITPEELLQESGGYPRAAATLTVEPENLAYIIYTSGSTGAPKGVAVTHSGICNNLLDLNRRWGVTSRDRVISVSSLSFDMSIYELLGAVLAGAAVVLPSVSRRGDPEHWLEVVESCKISVWNSAPMLLDALVEQARMTPERSLDSLRLALLGGDWVPLSLRDRLRTFAKDATLVALGGATEASIHSTFFPVETVAASWRSIPYGRPLSNQTAVILDEDHSPVAVGVPGQLFLSGAGLARGYHLAPRLTAERFIPNPLGAGCGERMYATGDLARYGEDGVIELLGRIDNQVKIRGVRVEPDGIAATLLQFTGVESAIVEAVDDTRGRRRLVAFVVCDDSISDGDLREFLSARLPSQWVPSLFQREHRFPLSSNGKVDRRALRASVRADAQPDAELGELTAVAAALAELWEGITGSRPTDATMSFFDCGGDSVRVLQLSLAIRREFGVRMPLGELYVHRTLREMAHAVECGLQTTRAGSRGASR